MSENKWYAVYTRVRWEKKVSELLSKKNIENYCPLNKEVRQWADRKKTVLDPLFTSYVFVRTTESKHIDLKKTDGVINMVYWLGKPAVIRDNEIDIIKRFLDGHLHITLEKTPVNMNDLVRVLSGPFMDYQGQVIAVKTKTVKIVLPSLGFIMSAEVETANVKLLQETFNNHNISHKADKILVS